MALQHSDRGKGIPKLLPLLHTKPHSPSPPQPIHPPLWSQLARRCSAFYQPHFPFLKIESQVQYILGFLHRSVWLRDNIYLLQISGLWPRDMGESNRQEEAAKEKKTEVESCVSGALVCVTFYSQLSYF